MIDTTHSKFSSKRKRQGKNCVPWNMSMKPALKQAMDYLMTQSGVLTTSEYLRYLLEDYIEKIRPYLYLMKKLGSEYAKMDPFVPNQHSHKNLKINNYSISFNKDQKTILDQDINNTPFFNALPELVRFALLHHLRELYPDVKIRLNPKGQKEIILPNQTLVIDDE